MFARLVPVLLLASLTAPAAEIGRPPAPSPVIAEGPLEVTVIPSDPHSGRALPPVDALLFRVAEKSVIYHRRGNLGETVIAEPEKGRNPVLRVQSKEGKEAWAWDSAARKFVGPKYRPPLDLTPKPATAAEETRYLYFAFGHLAERQNVALTDGDEAAIIACRQRADEVARYMARKGYSLSLTRLYFTAKDVEREYQARRKERDAVNPARDRELDAVDREAKYDQARHLAEELLGINKVRLGTRLKKTEVREGDKVTIWEQVTDPTLAQTGMKEMADAAFAYAWDEYKANQMRAKLTEEARVKFNELDKAMRKVLDDRWAEYRTLGQREFSQPAVWPADRDRMIAARDVFTKAALLEQQAERELVADRRGNPFRTAAICGCKGVGLADPVLHTAADPLALARRCVEASTLVPADPIHTPDRIEMLVRAAGLANRAAWPQIGVRHLDVAFHPYTLYAWQVVRELERMNPTDADTLYRQARMYALGGCGELVAAADMASQLSGHLSRNLAFQFHAARVFAGAGNEGQAAAHLSRAFQAGLPGREAIDNPDLWYAKRGPLLRLLTPGVKAAIRPGPQLEVTNTAEFPLTAVALRVEGTTNGRSVAKKLDPVPRIMPGETVYISLDLPKQFNRTTKLRVFGTTVEGGLPTVNNVPVR